MNSRKSSFWAVVLVFVLLCVYSTFVRAQNNALEKKTTSASMSFSSREEAINHFQSILDKDANNFDAHWQLASIYLSGGFGPEAIPHIEKALTIDEQKAIREGAYTMSIMAHYYAGEFKESYQAVEKALQINPEDKMAQAFKSMLETVAKRDFGGQLPEKRSWYGFKSAGEMGEAMIKQGRGFLGEKEDGIVFEFAQLYFTPPAGWSKQVNVPHKSGVSFLSYSKKPEGILPTIGVTKDTPPENVRQALDFTREVREMMLKMVPGITIAEPYNTTIARQQASVFDMQDKSRGLRTFWYQFLIEGNILSLQLMTTDDSFAEDFVVFKQFAESMRIEKNTRNVETP